MKPIVNATLLGLFLTVTIPSVSLAADVKPPKPAPSDRGNAQAMDAREREEIISFVVFTYAATEACNESHPALRGQLEDAMKAWRSRNKKYVDLALADRRFEGLKRDAAASRPTTPLSEALCRDTIRSLGVSAETDIDALKPRHSRASGNAQETIGYPSVNAALEALKRDPAAKVRQEGGWTIVSQKTEKDMVLWSFTPSAHPAHPAAVKRTLSEKNGAMQIQMSAVCESATAPCDKLVEDFRVLNGKMLEHIERQKSAPPDARPDALLK